MMVRNILYHARSKNIEVHITFRLSEILLNYSSTIHLHILALINTHLGTLSIENLTTNIV